MNNRLLSNVLITTISTTFLCSSAYSNDNNYDRPLKENSKTYSYVISADRHMSNNAVSDIMLSGIELYRQLDEALYSDNDSFLLKTFGYFTRLYVPSMLALVNHEVGGHGGRAREFRLRVTNYTFNLGGTGSTDFLINDFNKLTIHQKIAVDTGGIQANHVLAEKIKNRFINSEIINSTYGSAYISSQMDQTAYILSVKKDGNKDGHDIASYIKGINSIYGANHLTASKLKNYAYLDFVDPFFYYSLYSYITNENFEPPMIQVGDVKYLPALRIVLAPYGMERKLVNHFKYDDRYIKLSLSYGKNQKFKTHSLDLSVDKLHEYENFSFNLEATYWYQPKLLTSTPSAEKCKVGGYGGLNSEIKLMKNVSSMVSLGYKTNGFMENLPLKNSFIAKIGIKFEI